MSKEEDQSSSSNTIANVKLEKFEIGQLEQSRFIKPYQIRFLQNGKPRIWDAIITHPSVSCILYDTDKQVLILVKQFRPVVYVNQVIEANCDDQSQVHSASVANVNSLASNLDWSKVDPHKAFTYELCAGLCDKSKPLEETIREEIFEECGYHVSKEHPIRKVRTFRGSVGIMGSTHTIFYCEVNGSMKTGKGGGNEHEGELIELFELPKSKVLEFIEDEAEPKPPGLLFALLWFLYQRGE